MVIDYIKNQLLINNQSLIYFKSINFYILLPQHSNVPLFIYRRVQYWGREGNTAIIVLFSTSQIGDIFIVGFDFQDTLNFAVEKWCSEVFNQHDIKIKRETSIRFFAIAQAFSIPYHYQSYPTKSWKFLLNSFRSSSSYTIFVSHMVCWFFFRMMHIAEISK